MSKPVNKRGFTLIETLLSLGMFSVMAILLFQATRQGTQAWRNVETRFEAQMNLRRAEATLLQDLKGCSRASVNVTRVPSGGDAVWFLTATNTQVTFAGNETTGAIQRDPNDGTALWQRNVIYYLARPTAATHNDISKGTSCAADPSDTSTLGTEDRYCPHKMLIRKVVALPGFSSTVAEPSIGAGISAYLTEPLGFSTANMLAEAFLDNPLAAPQPPAPKIVAPNLLSFRITRVGLFVQVDLRAVRILEAQKEVGVGVTPLDTSRYILQHQFLVLPSNP